MFVCKIYKVNPCIIHGIITKAKGNVTAEDDAFAIPVFLTGTNIEKDGDYLQFPVLRPL
jgi:hypothetical protein